LPWTNLHLTALIDYCDKLEERVARLESALEKVDCNCSVTERLSGHLTDCFMPELEQALAHGEEGV
jgi:hypothetical protein